MEIEAKKNRRSLRLAGFNYGQPGGYFVTICAQGRKCLFGEIVDGLIRLNNFGKVIEEEWLRTKFVRPNVELDVYTLMPSHFHAVIELLNVGATRRVARHAKKADKGFTMKIDVQKYQKLYDRLALKEHPLAAYYTDEKPAQGIAPAEKGHLCIFALLNRARRKGETVYLDEAHTGCEGGAYYLGFRASARPKIEYFLSCGIPGEMEGERYIKTPELAREYFSSTKPRKAPAKYCVFKPLDKYSAAEEPEIVVFFAPPDVLSGLFTLTNYAAERPDAVRVPFSSGCGAILTHPLKEAEKESPQAILGLFDVSARPFVDPDILTLALPVKLFNRLLDNQDESFLITRSWQTVRGRIAKQEA